MEPMRAPYSPSGPTQSEHDNTNKQAVTNIIKDLTRIVISKTLEDQGKEVGILVTQLQRKVAMQELNSLSREALKALKVTLKTLQTQLQPDAHREIISGVNNLNSYLKGAISPEVTVVTNDNCQLKVDPESLRLRSEYFRAALSDRYKEGTELTLHFDGTAEEFNELYLLCKLDEKQLSKYISPDNVNHYFILADKYQIPSLQFAIVDWIADNMDDLDLHDAVGLVKNYAPDCREHLTKWVLKSCQSYKPSESTWYKNSPNVPATLLTQAIELDLPEWAPICTWYLPVEETKKFQNLAKEKGSKEIEKWCNFVVSYALAYFEKGLPYKLTSAGIEINYTHALIRKCHWAQKTNRDLPAWPLNEHSIKAFPNIVVDFAVINSDQLSAIIQYLPEYLTGITVHLNLITDINLVPLFDKLTNLTRVKFNFPYDHWTLFQRTLTEVLSSRSHLNKLTELCFDIYTFGNNYPNNTKALSIPLLQANIHKNITRLEIREHIFPQHQEFFAELHNYPDLTSLALATTYNTDDLVKIITMLTQLPPWIKKVELIHNVKLFPIDKKGEVVEKDNIARVIDSVNESRIAMGYSTIQIDLPNSEWRTYQKARLANPGRRRP